MYVGTGAMATAWMAKAVCSVLPDSLKLYSCSSRLILRAVSSLKSPEHDTTTRTTSTQTRIRPSTSRTPWLETGRKLLIWEGYKRNHKGAIPPAKTRIRCKRGRDKVCGNPCPICRSNINVHFKDTKLLKQFICPHTGQILEATKTGLCRQQQKRMVAAIEKAWDYGLIPYTVPRQLPEESLGVPPWNKLDLK